MICRQSLTFTFVAVGKGFYQTKQPNHLDHALGTEGSTIIIKTSLRIITVAGKKASYYNKTPKSPNWTYNF